MKIQPTKFLILIGSFVFLSIVSAVVTPLTAHADIFLDWAIDRNMNMSEGYFSNGGSSDVLGNRRQCGQPRCPVIPNDNYARDSLNRGYYQTGNSSTADSVQRARQLAADLRSFLASPDSWTRTGAAFIVNTMLGYGSDTPGKTRSPSPAMLADMEARLVDRATKGRINWNAYFNSGGFDTYTAIINNQYDIVYNGTDEWQQGIIIHSDDGGQAYRIWYSCANPVGGSMNGVPPAPQFELVPNITGSPGVIDSGGTVSLVPTIQNSQTGTSDPANWQTTTFVVPPSRPVPVAGTNTTAPTAYYGNGATTVATGTGTYRPGVNPIGVADQTAGDYPVGTRICYALSVSPYNRTGPGWRHSTPFCVVIAKKPKTQILGGDLVVGRGVALPGSKVVTSTSLQRPNATTTNMYGSWAEYGIVASGSVTGMASGAAYVGGAPWAPGKSHCDFSILTFSNNDGTGCTNAKIGSYAISTPLPQIAGRFPIPSPVPSGQRITAPSVDIRNLTPSLVHTTSQDNLTITSSADFNPGRWVVINAPNTTVTIASNINYTTQALTSTKDIPQVVIIAKNILIAPAVTKVDSWLIASGTGNDGIINTCSTVASGAPTSATLNANTCNNKLTVNGPIVVNKLFMYRTAGAGTAASTGDPAEVFNLRADAYVWASVYSPGNGRVPTISTKELPPRF